MQLKKRHFVAGLNQLKRIPINIIHSAYRVANRFMPPPAGSTLRYPVIFVVGAPRSGTTLIHEAIVQAFRVGFFSNLHHRYYMAPAVAESIYGISEKIPASGSYASDLGHINGLYRPSECWNFWYRFFPRQPHHVKSGALTESTLTGIHSEFLRLESLLERPFVVKNLPCAMRIEAIREAIPNSLFLYVKRGIINNALSILSARRKLMSNANEWWSVQPPNIAELIHGTPEEQSVNQVNSINLEIERCRRLLGTADFLDISYEEFCGDTALVLQDIVNFLRDHGCQIERRHTIPDKFPSRDKYASRSPEYLAIRNAVNNLAIN